MTTFMEQVVYSETWGDPAQQGPDAVSHRMPGSRPMPRAASSAVSVPSGAASSAALNALPGTHLPGTHRKTLLTSIVEAEILPRLTRSRSTMAATGNDIPTMTTADDARELVRLLLNHAASDAIAFVDKLRTRGATPASLYLGVVTQAARILGELWEQDISDFAQVTISMGRLQQVLRALSPHFQKAGVRRSQAESVMLVPAPGEQHTFGLVMLAEFFQREGWHVTGGPATSAQDAARIVRGTWLDVAAFSIGSASLLEGLAQCIRTVRRASRNPSLYIMVGGPLFLTQPDLVSRVGADAAATDAPDAVRQAQGLLAMRMAAD